LNYTVIQIAEKRSVGLPSFCSIIHDVYWQLGKGRCGDYGRVYKLCDCSETKLVETSSETVFLFEKLIVSIVGAFVVSIVIHSLQPL